MGTKGIERWCDMAEAEAEALMGALPLSLREKLSGVSVTVSGRPSPEDIMEEGDEENLLGLFVGAALRDEGADAELSPEIRLFVENIRDEAGSDTAAFRREVRDTLLHEIGHYLGLDEDALELRGL